MLPLYSTQSTTTGKPPGMVLTDTEYFLDSTLKNAQSLVAPT
jgi:hypothetical protein